MQGRHDLAEIEAQGWSLNPGRYVGVAERAADDFEFAVRLEELNEELETLNVEARELEERIAENVAALLEGTANDDRRTRMLEQQSRRLLTDVRRGQRLAPIAARRITLMAVHSSDVKYGCNLGQAT